MGKIISLILFSVLLLAPVSTLDVFANHPAVCPFGGSLNTLSDLVVFGTTNSNFCVATGNPPPSSGCPPNYSSMTIDSISFPGITQQICGALPVIPVTLAAQCQNNAVLLNNHCVPDLSTICGSGTFSSGLQCLALGMKTVGGTLVEIDTVAVFVAGIGVNPLITGLVALSIAGVAGQTTWLVYKKKNKSENS